MAANTYTLISSQVLGSATATVTFNSIPSTYTDLILRVSARSTGNIDLVTLTFNGDTATNYSRTMLRGSGSAADSSTQSSQTSLSLDGTTDPSSYTANTFASCDIYIPSYTASQNKPNSSFGATETNATAAYIISQANLWRNTAAITSIALGPSGTTFVTGSSFYLYGIKNS
jgi:hypothetical protein